MHATKLKTVIPTLRGMTVSALVAASVARDFSVLRCRQHLIIPRLSRIGLGLGRTLGS